MRYLLDCEVIQNDEVAPEQFRMLINAPEISRSAVAGQFCMLQVAEGMSPFLRRPMCFERILRDQVSFLYKVEGEGTRLLAKMRAGTTLGVQGPLGNGFPIDRKFERHIIVSGGIGVATFPALAEALLRKCGVAPDVILAARSKHLILCADEFRAMGCKVFIATDDGTAGEKLFASQMLEKLKPGPNSRVYVCGPMIMMKTTSDVAMKAGADCVVSLEAQMACGDGACLGCVVESKREKEGEKMVRVCLDGPVFDTTVIDWAAHNMAYDR